MSDDKTKKGGQDRRKIAGNEDYEIQYEKEKTGASAEEIKESIGKKGSERADVEKDLEKKK